LLGRAALEDIEAIRFAITHYGGRMSEVARRLRIGRSTPYRRLDSLGRDVCDAKTPAW
jgi:DNA-binding NtrC family response regulator